MSAAGERAAQSRVTRAPTSFSLPGGSARTIRAKTYMEAGSAFTMSPSGNPRRDLLKLAVGQLRDHHLGLVPARIGDDALSANTMSQLIEILVRSRVSIMLAPNSVPKLSRSGAPCQQLAPRRAGMKFQINAVRW
jgi:hypothetical protein